MSFYYIEIETKGYYMGEIVKQNSKLKPRCCLLRGNNHEMPNTKRLYIDLKSY